MFEFQYSYSCLSKIVKDTWVNQYKNQKALLPLMWGEHCIECSAPQCYSTCSRYLARMDGHCRRFENGIEAVEIGGKIGAKVVFKPWAKLEAKVEQFSIEGTVYQGMNNKICSFGILSAKIACIMPGFRLKSKTFGAWETYRLHQIKSAKGESAEGKMIELFFTILNEKSPTSIFVDLKSEDKNLLMREKICIPVGRTSFSLILQRFHEASVVNIHPTDVDSIVELIFEELEARVVDRSQEETITPKKVKCVIWDLDNTLWNGILVESKTVEPRADFVDLIKCLDAKGIVNSIASKNNEEQVMPILERAGIADFFVFKRINWKPKSQNIQGIIKGMNINANTFVFVDDNPFERDEVKAAIPAITCIDPSDILSYAKTGRFDVPLSDETSKRRETYKMLERLNKEQEAWTGNIDSFLLTCQIELTISRPTEHNIARCYELLQRTNQLNSSGRRLSMEEVYDVVNSSHVDCYVMESTDKFGSYGIVGFMIVDCSGDKPCITDFVISCRVANKKIEPTLINYLAKKYDCELLFNFKKTKLNGPMKCVIEELAMELRTEVGDLEIYSHRYNANYPHIVTLTDQMLERN